MKNFPVVLTVLFFLIGLHIPKAFTILYLAVAAVWSIECFSPRPLRPLPQKRLILFDFTRVLVFVFSCAYTLAMLKFGFWELHGRDLLDVFGALILPSALLWSGLYLLRRDPMLFVNCLLAYCGGALLFLVFALIKTRGLGWFAYPGDPASLLLPWGSETSINVRSIEQGGILAIAMAPVSLFLLSHKRFLEAVVLFSASLLGLFAVLPLFHGRLWIPSLIAAAFPLVTIVVIRISKRAHKVSLAIYAGLAYSLVSIISLLERRNLMTALCDERFFLYAEAFRNWKLLIAGGRDLAFTAPLCDGSRQMFLSLKPNPSSTIEFLHNVPLDILASVGIGPFLPLALCLVVAMILYFQLWLSIFLPGFSHASRARCLVLWSFTSVLVIQWLFQPLIYGDGIFYYLSYLSFGAIFALPTSFE